MQLRHFLLLFLLILLPSSGFAKTLVYQGQGSFYKISQGRKLFRLYESRQQISVPLTPCNRVYFDQLWRSVTKRFRKEPKNLSAKNLTELALDKEKIHLSPWSQNRIFFARLPGDTRALISKQKRKCKK